MVLRNVGKEVGELIAKIAGSGKEAAVEVGSLVKDAATKKMDTSILDKPKMRQATPEDVAYIEAKQESIGKIRRESGEPGPTKELKNFIDNATDEQVKPLMGVLSNMNTRMEGPVAREYFNGVLGVLKVESPLTPEQIAERMIEPADIIGQKLSVGSKEEVAKELRSVFNQAFERDAFDRRELQLRNFIEPIIGKQKVDAILIGKEYEGPRLARLQKLEDYAIAAQDRFNVYMKQQKSGLFKEIDRGSENFETALNNLYEKFSEAGLSMPADGIRVVHAHHTVGKATARKLYSMGVEWKDGLEIMGKKLPGANLAIRDYIKIASNFTERQFGPTGAKIQIDVGALDTVQKMHKVSLTDEHMIHANRGITMLRTLARERQKQRELGKFEDDTPQYSVFDIDGTKPQLRDKIFGGLDFGPNYWPTVPTAEFKAKVLEKATVSAENATKAGQAISEEDKEIIKRMGLKTTLESTHDDFLSGAQTTYFLNKKSAEGSLQMSDADLLAPEEEFGQMLKQWLGHVTTGTQKKLMQQLKATVLLPADPASKMNQPIFKEIQDIEKFAEYITTTHKPMEGALAVVNNVVGATISAILARPKMSPLNLLQFNTNGTSEHGFFKSLAATASAGVYMPFFAVKNRGDMRKAWLDAAHNFKDPQKRETISRIMSESSESRKFLDEELMGELGTRTKGFLNLLTSVFEMTDKGSRLAAMSRGYDQAAEALGTFRKTLAKGGDHGDAMFKLAHDDLHLGAWKQIGRENFLTAVKNGDDKRAIYEYAKYATDSKNFIYSKDAAPRMLAWARAQHPLAGWATTFLSYTPNYLQVIKGAFKAAKEGDGKPLANLTLYAFAWIGAWKAVQGLTDDDDEKTLAKWMGIHPEPLARYFIDKGPVMNLTGFLDMPTRPLIGVGEGAVAITNQALYKTLGMMDKHLNEFFDVHEIDSLGYKIQMSERNYKKSTIPRMSKQMMELYELMANEVKGGQK